MTTISSLDGVRMIWGSAMGKLLNFSKWSSSRGCRHKYRESSSRLRKKIALHRPMRVVGAAARRAYSAAST
jgi:hypothetical protein